MFVNTLTPAHTSSQYHTFQPPTYSSSQATTVDGQSPINIYDEPSPPKHKLPKNKGPAPKVRLPLAFVVMRSEIACFKVMYCAV